MMYKNFFFRTAAVTLLLLNGALTSAQVTIGDNKEPQSFSVLELISGDNKGLRLPQIANDEQRQILENSFSENPLAALGLSIFNMCSRCVETWNGAGWIKTCATEEPDYVEIACSGTTIRWAKFNVDMPGEFVQNETDYGMYYQWGRKVGWFYNPTLTNSNGGTTYDMVGWNTNTPTASGMAWLPENDPCPNGWRVPTEVELQCLRDAGFEWKYDYKGSGINGTLFGTAPNQIFLPAAGWIEAPFGSGILRYINTTNCYWSNKKFTSSHGDETTAYGLDLTNNNFWFGQTSMYYGYSVRCVKE